MDKFAVELAKEKGWRVRGKHYKVSDLVENYRSYSDWRKGDKADRVSAALLPFFRALNEGKDSFSDKELLELPYYAYLQDLYKNTGNPHGRCLRKIRQSTKLFASVKSKGLYAPLEMYLDKGRLNIFAGTRRLMSAFVLGHENIAVRVYESRAVANELSYGKHEYMGKL